MRGYSGVYQTAAVVIHTRASWRNIAPDMGRPYTDSSSYESMTYGSYWFSLGHYKAVVIGRTPSD